MWATNTLRLPKTFSGLYLQPNLITNTIKGILDAYFVIDRFVSDQVQARFHMDIFFSSNLPK